MKSKEGNKDIHNRVQLRDESADEVLTRRKRLRQYERDKEYDLNVSMVHNFIYLID